MTIDYAFIYSDAKEGGAGVCLVKGKTNHGQACRRVVFAIPLVVKVSYIPSVVSLHLHNFPYCLVNVLCKVVEEAEIRVAFAEVFR